MEILNADELTKLYEMYAANSLNAVRAKAYVMSGFGDPYAMRADETFELEQDGRQFKYKISKSVCFEGAAQIMAHFDVDTSQWRWALDLANDIQLRPFLKKLIPFPILNPKQEAGDAITEVDFANWLALRLGYFGAYFVLTTNGYDLVAVTIENPSHPNEKPKWCTVCGDYGSKKNALLDVGNSLWICQTSARECIDVLDSTHGEEGQPSSRLCACCGHVTSPVIGTPYYFLCQRCIEKLRTLLS